MSTSAAFAPAAVAAPPLAEAAADLLSRMANCCHDPQARADWIDMELAALLRENDAHRRAINTAHLLAEVAGRQEAWTSVRARAVAQVTRGCTACGRTPALAGLPALAVVVDGLCALVVADLLTPETLTQLAGPLEPWLH